VVAPHATFVDPLVICLSGSVPVAKEEFRSVPFISQIAIFAQVLFVKREKQESRKDAKASITGYVENVMVRKLD
jgi:1-acyl-sn-glycerol-3-phosphate acyltransferase